MAAPRNYDNDLIIRAAWLYYVHGMGQEEVARTLSISRSKVTRILSSARDSGVVKISIEHEMTENMALGDWIKSTYGVRECIITPFVKTDTGDTDLSERLGRQAVGIVAANHISRRLQNAGALTLGLGGGQTLAELVVAFPSMAKSDLRVVSLAGASSLDDGNGSYSLALKFAGVTGGQAYTYPVPLVVTNPATRAALESDTAVRDTLELARNADLKVLSCSDCSAGNTFFSAARLDPKEIDEVSASGAICEIGGCFLTADGALAPTSLNQRTMGIGLEALKGSDVVVLAAGRRKAAPLKALMKAGLAQTIVIDNAVAEELVGRPAG